MIFPSLPESRPVPNSSLEQSGHESRDLRGNRILAVCLPTSQKGTLSINDRATSPTTDNQLPDTNIPTFVARPNQVPA